MIIIILTPLLTQRMIYIVDGHRPVEQDLAK
jgi:hypothetical protein